MIFQPPRLSYSLTVTITSTCYVTRYQVPFYFPWFCLLHGCVITSCNIRLHVVISKLSSDFHHIASASIKKICCPHNLLYFLTLAESVICRGGSKQFIWFDFPVGARISVSKSSKASELSDGAALYQFYPDYIEHIYPLVLLMLNGWIKGR